MCVRRFLTLDLETVPDEELVGAVAGAPGRPYAEQLGRVVAERRARSGGRSDFLPLPYHRPVAACSLEAIEDGGVVSVSDLSSWTDRSGPGDERSFLERFWERAEGATLVTFHGRGFDLPVLELRSLKHAVPLGSISAPGPAMPAAHFDVKEALTSRGAAQAAPLDLYAKLVGLPGKEEVVGADVQGLYAAGDLDRIAAYCMTDVVQTFLLFLRCRLLDGSLTPDGYAESAAAARAQLPALFARRLRGGERRFLEGFLDRCAPFFGDAGAVRRVAL
ncbi:MAG: 3'-5' exonuclease [Anaeromyxobacteraceae bacterium]